MRRAQVKTENFTINEKSVKTWLTDFLNKLKVSFGKRLLFVGHQGSWARGEGEPGSDIDVIVVLDNIGSQDLAVFRDIVARMPEAERVASGVFTSVSELQAWPRWELLQFFYGCKSLHGSVNGIVPKPNSEDLVTDIRVKASYNLFAARHYLLYPHELSKVVHRLNYPFKYSFYALQSWVLFRDGKFVARKDELLDILSDNDDREVVRVARDWRGSEKDREARPLYYIRLLERQSKNMLSRIQIYESKQRSEGK